MPPESPENPKALLIGEEPGNNEVRLGRPMVGASGQLLERQLGRLGYLRDEVALDNALLCRPPDNDLVRFMSEVVGPWNATILERNRGKKVSERLPKHPSPQFACRPHVERAVDQAARRGIPVIALGKLAYWSVTGRTAKMAKVRGSFGEYVRLPYGPKAGNLVEPTPELLELVGPLEPIKVTATINPAFALHKAAYKEVLYRDLDRAFRWHEGRLQWEDPQPSLLSMHPDPAWLVDWLSRGTYWTWDLETTPEGEHLNKLRTVGIYSMDRREGVVIPWVSIDGRTGFAPGLTLTNPYATDRLEHQRKRPGQLPWWEDFEDHHYGEDQGQQIRAALWRWLERADQIKIGHYSNYFDYTVMERHLGHFQGQGMIDQILLARMWGSEYPRSLYFVGTMLTDVPAWKAAEDERKVAHDPRTYEELARYNHVDNVVVSKTAPVLLRCAQENWSLAELDHQVESICREMSHLGIYVDEPTRAQLEEETRDKLKVELDHVVQVAGPKFNPRSSQQLAKLLYKDWRYPVSVLTNRGQPATNEDAIRVLLTTPGLLKAEHRVLLEALWKSRGLSKDLGDVILKLRRRSQGGIVYDDGVLRAGYGAHIPATGRISSSGGGDGSDPDSGMNTQNLRKILRKMMKPRPGHVFVISDYDQVELRLMSAIAQVQMYLEEFARPNSDPHAITALLVYGDVFRRELEIKKATGKKTALYDSLRRFAKTFVYAVLYGGGASTVYDNVSKATDPDTGELLFPDMTLPMVRAAVNTWMRNAPEIPRWWAKTIRFAEENGYVEEPILGRRRHMPAVARNEALNMPVQGGAGIIMGQGLVRLRRALPPDFARGIGIVNQMHDAATLEVPESQARYWCDLTTETLTARYPDKLPGMTFTTEAQAFLDWAEIQKFAC